MKQNTLYHGFFLLIVLPVLCMYQAGCAKEYSFEGADTVSAIVNDTLATLPVVREFQCSLCHEDEELKVNTWNFKTGNSYLCGNTDHAGFVGTGKTFTFFGPSACSIDTGLVITVYLPAEMNKDVFNLTASQTAFYYYTHGAYDLFISQSGTVFTLLVKSYIQATRVATGTFEGTVFRANGDKAYIREGKFRVVLK